jgi:uncharacterized membrane protein YkvA (DUF1232 family)
MQGLLNYFLLVWKLLWDRRVPIYAKLAFGLPLLYLISPIDILPDFILGIGQLDDLALLVAGMKMLEVLSPADVVAEHRSELASRGAAAPGRGENVVHSPGYRVIDEDKAKRG